MRIVSVSELSPPSLRGLPPNRSFAEASAQVEAALGELRAAELALERQLSDLRCYLRVNDVPSTGSRVQLGVQ